MSDVISHESSLNRLIKRIGDLLSVGDRSIYEWVPRATAVMRVYKAAIDVVAYRMENADAAIENAHKVQDAWNRLQRAVLEAEGDHRVHTEWPLTSSDELLALARAGGRLGIDEDGRLADWEACGKKLRVEDMKTPNVEFYARWVREDDTLPRMVCRKCFNGPMLLQEQSEDWT